ncbi:hypothetical protein R6Q57_021441 [Mikania cordata]
MVSRYATEDRNGIGVHCTSAHNTRRQSSSAIWPQIRARIATGAAECRPFLRTTDSRLERTTPPQIRAAAPFTFTARPSTGTHHGFTGVVNAELFFPFAITVKMRNLAAQISFYLCRRKPVNVRSRPFSSSSHERGFPDERAMEEEAERKIGWLFKLIFAGTATIVGYNIFPYLGDNLIQQSVSLLDVKDPLFKRMGASRLTRFATDDERRMKIVEMGGAKKLVEMLGAAKDDPTRKEALNAIVAIAHSDEAAGALHNAGAISVIMDTKSAEDEEIEKYKEKLLKRFRGIKQV